MMTFFNEEMRRDPYPAYRQMRAASPVLEVPAFGLWALFDHDSVRRAVLDHEAFSSASPGARGVNFEWLLFMDPPRHTKLRALISRAFTPRSIAALEPRIEAIARELVGRMIERGEGDLVEGFAAPLPIRVIAAMLGLPEGDWPRFRAWSDAIIALGQTIVGDPEASRRASEAFLAADAEMRAYVGPQIEARRRAPADDLLTRLAEAEVDGEWLTDDQIVRFFQLLLVAGTETTTNLLSNAVVCLTDHPGELERLRASPALLPSAIEEVLRYRSPFQAVFRATTAEVNVSGKTIPAGKFVLALVGSANRDPARFAEPDRFDIGRDPNPHLAFGQGIHFCLGAPLSRLEARVALGELLSRTRGIEVTSKAWEPRVAFHVHGPQRLAVRLEAR